VDVHNLDSLLFSQQVEQLLDLKTLVVGSGGTV